MRTRTTVILSAAAVVALGLAWQFGIRATPSAQFEVSAGTLVFPGLAAKLGQVAKVEIQSKGVTLDIVQAKGKWGLADRGGYPVQQDKLRELLTGMTELRITEPRTSDPTQYNRLGVEDPGSPTGTSNLVRLLAADGKPVAELIVGHRRVRTQGNVPETIFIRRPGEEQSWLAEGRMPADADPQLWFEREIANIPGASVAKVVSTRGDTELDFARNGDKFELTAPAEHPKLDDYRVEDVSRALESLTLTDVHPAKQEPGEKIGNAVVTTAAGMAVAVTVYRADKDIWIQLAAIGTGDAKKDADALQARVGGWAYQVGAWKEKSFVPTMDDLKASEPEKPADPAKPASE
jgi:hypothetical protein